MTESKTVNLDVADFIATIMLDNPPVNALSTHFVQELTDAAKSVDELVESGEVRVVIIAAEGSNFCAGADLKERAGMSDDEVESAVLGIRGAVDAVWNIRVPVIAAIQGSAFGGGLELALAADIRIITEDAQIGLKETMLAIIPGAGGTVRLSRIIGFGRAMEFITTGKTITPAEALISGLANFIASEESILSKTREMAVAVASNGPVAVQAAKKAIREGFDLTTEEAMKIEWREYKKTIPTADRVEGLKAFLEKRKPVYKGK